MVQLKNPIGDVADEYEGGLITLNVRVASFAFAVLVVCALQCLFFLRTPPTPNPSSFFLFPFFACLGGAQAACARVYKHLYTSITIQDHLRARESRHR